MTPNQISEVCSVIADRLKAACKAYYNTGNPLMSDSDYDSLVDQLKRLAPDHPFLNQVGAPPASSTWKVVKHDHPVGSQDKLKSKEEFLSWAKKLGQTGFALQQKLDGLTLVLYYKDGKLTNAVTRGSGFEGEDILANAVKMQNVMFYMVRPVSGKKGELEPYSFTGSLRGEILLSISDFKKHFEPLGFKNPRNTVSGKSRDTQAGDLLKYLKVVYFDVIGCGAKTEDEKMKFLDDMGLEHVHHEIINDTEEVWRRYKEIEQERASLDWEIDGVVVKANDLVVQDKLGSDGNLRPRGQRCVKFEAQEAETVLEDILWTIGHSGVVCPTGKVKPVEIGGVTVTNVLLNNLDEFERLNLKTLGCTVKLIRAGDVIPKAVAVVKQGDRPLNVPTHCPSCKTKLIRNGPALLCPNDECEGRLVRKVRRWLDSLDIKFIGPEIEQALWDAELVRDPANLYTLKDQKAAPKSDISLLSQLKIGASDLGESRAKQILAEIDKTRELPLHMFFGSLGIQFLGARAAKHFVDDHGINTVEKFSDPDLIRNTTSIGPVIREKVADGIKAALPLIKKLLKHIKVVNPAKEIKQMGKTEGKLGGASYCFTGALPSGMGRSEAQELVRQAGGVVKDSVSKELQYLVIADPSSTSSKARKARELGVKLISEEEFRKMM
jgi:DNA ligase (NAD+)